MALGTTDESWGLVSGTPGFKSPTATTSFVLTEDESGTIPPTGSLQHERRHLHPGHRGWRKPLCFPPPLTTSSSSFPKVPVGGDAMNEPRAGARHARSGLPNHHEASALLSCFTWDTKPRGSGRRNPRSHSQGRWPDVTQSWPASEATLFTFPGPNGRKRAAHWNTVNGFRATLRPSRIFKGLLLKNHCDVSLRQRGARSSLMAAAWTLSWMPGLTVPSCQSAGSAPLPQSLSTAPGGPFCRRGCQAG